MSSRSFKNQAVHLHDNGGAGAITAALLALVESVEEVNETFSKILSTLDEPEREPVESDLGGWGPER